MRFTRRLLVLTVAAAVTLIPGPAAASGPSVSLVTAGLDSPRAVIFMGGHAVVSESGHGGPTCFAPEPGFNICYGPTSRISSVNISSGARSTVADGFLSVSLGPEGTEGVMGLAQRDGHLLAQVGGTTREMPPGPLTQQAGHLMSVNPATHSFHPIASVGDFDFDYTLQFPEPTPGVYSPGTQEHDANPTGLLAREDGILVADSGANTITRVSNSGRVSVVQYFPWRDANPNNFPSDEVPTCLAQTEDSVWLGTLAGHLYRITGAAAHQVVPMAAGKQLLSHVTGCTADEDGNLYLVNMFGPGTFGSPQFPVGSVVKYNTSSHQGSVLATAMDNPLLFLPYQAAIGPDGNLYVTAGAMCDSAGHNPFGGGPFNPCQLGPVVGGRLVKIALPHSSED